MILVQDFTAHVSVENLDLHQLYMNNLFQYHQLRLQQLYQQTQKLLLNQSDQRFCPTINDLQPWHHDFQACVKEMQYHCLESLRLQYPGYSLSLPYTPSSDPEYLSYRQQFNACDGFDQDHPMSSIHIDDHDGSRLHADDEHRSMDDRVTIDTCHGLIEYCSKFCILDQILNTVRQLCVTRDFAERNPDSWLVTFLKNMLYSAMFSCF